MLHFIVIIGRNHTSVKAAAQKRPASHGMRGGGAAHENRLHFAKRAFPRGQKAAFMANAPFTACFRRFGISGRTQAQMPGKARLWKRLPAFARDRRSRAKLPAAPRCAPGRPIPCEGRWRAAKPATARIALAENAIHGDCRPLALRALPGGPSCQHAKRPIRLGRGVSGALAVFLRRNFAPWGSRLRRV